MGAFVVFKIISLFFAFGGLVAVSVDGTPHEDVRRELSAAIDLLEDNVKKLQLWCSP